MTLAVCDISCILTVLTDYYRLLIIIITLACHPNCTNMTGSGLMRCTGNGSNECCPIFEDTGYCSSDPHCDRQGFVALADNQFICCEYHMCIPL